MQTQAAEQFLKFIYLHRTPFVIALGFFVVVFVVGALFLIRSMFIGAPDVEVVRDQIDQVESELDIVGRDLPPFPDLVIEDPFAEIVISELDAPAPSAVKSHLVQKGDTLWHIAETYLDSPYQYHSLAAFNSIDNPDLIYPGQVIYFSAGEISEHAAAIDLDEPAGMEKTDATYLVQSGDSLWSIAERQLGNPYAWTELYAINKQRIGDNPNLIFPEQVFMMPERIGPGG